MTNHQDSNPASFLISYYFNLLNRSRRWNKMMVGKRGDLLMFSGLMMILPVSMKLQNWGKISKKSIALNLYSRRKIEAITRNHFWIYLLIEDNKFSIQLYDKKDDFPLGIVIMPYLRSKIIHPWCFVLNVNLRNW